MATTPQLRLPSLIPVQRSSKAQYLLGTLPEAEQRKYLASSRNSRRASLTSSPSTAPHGTQQPPAPLSLFPSNLSVPLYAEAFVFKEPEPQKRSSFRRAFSKLSLRHSRSNIGGLEGRSIPYAVLVEKDEAEVVSPFRQDKSGVTSRSGLGPYSAPSPAAGVSDRRAAHRPQDGPRAPRREWFDDIGNDEEGGLDGGFALHSARSVFSAKHGCKASSVLGQDVSSQTSNYASHFVHARRHSDTLSRNSIIFEHTIVSLSDSDDETKPVKTFTRKDSGYRSLGSSESGREDGPRTPQIPDIYKASHDLTYSLFPAVPSKREAHPKGPSQANGISQRPQKFPAHLASLPQRADALDDSGSDSLPSLSPSYSTAEPPRLFSQAAPPASKGLRLDCDSVIVSDEPIIMTPVDAMENESEPQIITDLKHGSGTNRIIAAISPEEAILISRLRRHRTGPILQLSSTGAIERLDAPEDYARRSLLQSRAPTPTSKTAPRSRSSPTPPLPIATPTSSSNTSRPSTADMLAAPAPSLLADSSCGAAPSTAAPTSAPNCSLPAVPATSSTLSVSVLPTLNSTGSVSTKTPPLAPPRTSSLRKSQLASCILNRPDSKRWSVSPPSPPPVAAPPPPPALAVPALSTLVRNQIQRFEYAAPPQPTSPPPAVPASAIAPPPSPPPSTPLPSLPTMEPFQLGQNPTSPGLPAELSGESAPARPRPKQDPPNEMYSPSGARDVLSVLRQLGG